MPAGLLRLSGKKALPGNPLKNTLDKYSTLKT